MRIMAPWSKRFKIRPFQGREGGFESPRGYSIYREGKPSNREGKINSEMLILGIKFLIIVRNM